MKPVAIKELARVVGEALSGEKRSQAFGFGNTFTFNGDICANPEEGWHGKSTDK